MSQQREAILVAEDGQSITGLRARLTLWDQVLLFFKKKPLGTVGAVLAFFVVVVAIFAPLIQTQEVNLTDHNKLYAKPSGEMFLGGDHLGRDMFSRLVAGSRISIRVGLISALVGCTVGLIIGVSSAYFGGIYDLILQRIIDSVIAFPGLVLALALMAALGSSINNVIIALSISFMPTTVRLIRSQALAVKEMDYVLAANAVGANSARIIFRHMIPNVFAIWIVTFTFLMGTAIIAEASLSFLGAGIPAPTPAWGGMVNDGRNYLDNAWWVSTFPGIAILLTVMSFNFLGDWLRDRLDPRLRQI